MAQTTVRVRGLAELQRALRMGDKQLAKRVREGLREAGNIVRDNARGRFSDESARTAGGFRTVVRVRGVAVEQRYGRTTGKRPDWGAIQMREAFLPALEAKQGEVVDVLDDALDRLGRDMGF